MLELGGLTKKSAAAPAIRENDEALSPAAITDAGCERDLNEDRYAVIESEAGLLWLVCDGMGGVKGGELAAQLAIDSIRRNLEASHYTSSEKAIVDSIQEANRVVVLRRQNQTFGQMGTTLVGAIFNGQAVSIVNVGDSRAYVVSARGQIRQITLDDTYVQELVSSGKISPQEALNHPNAHVLTKAIGADASLRPKADNYWIWDTGGDPQEQDSLVLCSDGLYSMVGDEEIAKAVSRNSPRKACAVLVEEAKRRGGYDNITLAVIPLLGKLKNEMPPGYRSQPLISRLAEKRKATPEDIKQSLIKNIMIISGLSLISLLFVFVLILLKLSK